MRSAIAANDAIAVSSTISSSEQCSLMNRYAAASRRASRLAMRSAQVMAARSRSENVGAASHSSVPTSCASSGVMPTECAAASNWLRQKGA